MYDIRQFRLALYVLLIVGISSFALAAQLVGIWLLALLLILLNGWLVAVGRFRPMSRLLANAITVLSVLYVVRELFTSTTTPVIIIGEFLVFLQIVKLWERRANRDYAQLLILSLLLVVAASMNTASLWFGVLLVIYLFLSLYCCLLFHLKVETDAAKDAMPVSEEQLSPGTLKQDQRKLSRSLRRLTALVSAVSVTSAVIVFLFLPRGSGAGLLGPMQPTHGGYALTGFSDQVSFQDVARISQSGETVAFVKVWHNDKIVAGTASLLLRGLTLDTYRPSVRSEATSWDWVRTLAAPGASPARPSDPLLLSGVGEDRWRQQISLWPTHSDVLFALAGPMRLTPRLPIKLRYTPGDGALQTIAPLNDRIDYEVVSTGELGQGDSLPAETAPASLIREQYARIYEYARRAEVCGSDARGPLADQRIRQGDVSDLDEKIAGNIETYLRDHFSYTLDLTDEKNIRGRDPLEAFLYDWKKGHCEYFAGAMTLMCQSLGMQARMVIGFKCDGDDYNSLNQQYTVHDSDAHAWVEVKTPAGWKTFDPTSSMEADAGSRSGFMTRARHLLEYLEFNYANAIIAYDSQNQTSVIITIEAALATTASRGESALAEFNDFVRHSVNFWKVSTTILTCFMLLMLAIVAAVFTWFIGERWMLRRRAQRIGIESLPNSEQFRLARQLGFYDDLLRLLDRHHIRQAAHVTPMEFSRSLSFLPADAYDTIHRLTELFYKVRYGGTELPIARRRRLNNVLEKLAQDLGRPNGFGVPLTSAAP